MEKRQGWVRNFSHEAQKRIMYGECPMCGKHKSKWNRRTDWLCCSKECSDKFYKEEQAIQDWSLIRVKAFQRDNYCCRMCGKKEDSFHLIGDHIIPIAIGGEEFNIDNVQTLCIQCNKIKTKQDAFVIAQRRRCEKLGIKPTKQDTIPIPPDVKTSGILGGIL